MNFFQSLDAWLLPSARLQSLLKRRARDADVALIEGVMGLFDGVDATSDTGSTAEIAKWLGAPVLLVIDARRRDDVALERYFLRRATIAAAAAGAAALAGIVILHMDAPDLAGGLTRVGWPLIGLSGLCGVLALVSLRGGARSGTLTRGLAIGAVASIVWGWGVAQYPDILPGSLSLADAAAPDASLGALLVVFIVAALVIGPSLGLLYLLVQRSRLEGHGLGTDISNRGDGPQG